MRAGGFGDEVGGGGVQRGDVCAQEEGLAVFHQHVGVSEVGLAHAQALDLPAAQGHTGLEGLQQVVIEACALVAGDNVVVFLGFLPGHGAHYTYATRRINVIFPLFTLTLLGQSKRMIKNGFPG